MQDVFLMSGTAMLTENKSNPGETAHTKPTLYTTAGLNGQESIAEGPPLFKHSCASVPFHQAGARCWGTSPK